MPAGGVTGVLLGLLGLVGGVVPVPVEMVPVNVLLMGPNFILE